MSKSLGNGILLQDLLKNYNPDAIKMTMLLNNYKSDLNVVDGLFENSEEQIYLFYKLMILVDKLSYEEIGRRYNCSGSNIKKVASRIGIELPKRRKINDSKHFNKGTGKFNICLNCGKEFKKISGYSNKFCCGECEKV